MSTHVGISDDFYKCETCKDMITRICWDSESTLLVGPYEHVPVFCGNCCPHSSHDNDYRPVANDDHIEKKRIVEVLCKFEITGDKSHANKLTAKVKKEMRVQFGNLYKEDK